MITMRILLVDDEVKLTQALAQLLSEQQYVTDVAHDGVSGLDMGRAEVYDVLIIDVMLPGMSGYEIVRTLRDEGVSTPTLLLTAKDAVDDRVQGLDSGADDYLVKPFATTELLARIRALTRRTGDVMGTKELAVGEFRLNLLTRQVSCRDAAIHLTAKEFQLLELFLRNPGQVLPKELILDRVWGLEAPLDTNAVEIYVHFLRKKLLSFEATGGEPLGCSIETVRGVGYVLKGL